MQTEAIHKDVLVHHAPSHSPASSPPRLLPPSPPSFCCLFFFLLTSADTSSASHPSPSISDGASHRSVRQMNTSSAVLSFISASNLFINAHKAVAGTYHWQSPLSCLSDETEVAEFTKRSYGGMDVTGSGGRLHISLHNIHKPVHLHEIKSQSPENILPI